MAIVGNQRLPVLPQIGNELPKLSRQAGFIPNKQNPHDTFPWRTAADVAVDMKDAIYPIWREE